MGMYTEIVIAVSLPISIPNDASNALQIMAGDMSYGGGVLIPRHPLFNDGKRWQQLMRGDSYYFDGEACSKVRIDDLNKYWFVTVRGNLKNYGDEIKLFCEWLWSLSKKLNYSQFVGYTRYEEEGHPTLIYFTPNGVDWRTPTNKEEG